MCPSQPAILRPAPCYDVVGSYRKIIPVFTYSPTTANILTNIFLSVDALSVRLPFDLNRVITANEVIRVSFRKRRCWKRCLWVSVSRLLFRLRAFHLRAVIEEKLISLENRKSRDAVSLSVCRSLFVDIKWMKWKWMSCFAEADVRMQLANEMNKRKIQFFDMKTTFVRNRKYMLLQILIFFGA